MEPSSPPATPSPAGLRAIAVDGKALRGSRTATTPHVTLLAAMDHTGHVLAQRQVADKSNEIPAFKPLLDTIDLTDTVITADALHTQHTHGVCLRDRGAHYIAQVKANHPGLFDRVRHLPWREITLDHHERTRAHHRTEIRRLKTTAFAHLDYPVAITPRTRRGPCSSHRDSLCRNALIHGRPAGGDGTREAAHRVPPGRRPVARGRPGTGRA
ncbi:ISAs1 family transposase, partial [Streptomyces phaeochromogenes]